MFTVLNSIIITVLLSLPSSHYVTTITSWELLVIILTETVPRGPPKGVLH